MVRCKARAPRWWTRLALAAAIVAGSTQALAQAQEAAPPSTPSSLLDAPLFYQLLIGEVELAEGRAGNAYQILLDAARKSGDEGLYRRTVEIALRAQAGNEALAAVKAWRVALPMSADALRYQVQILLALNRPDELTEPVASWLANAAVADRPGLIAALPRLLQGVPDRNRTLDLVERLVGPYLDQPETRTVSRVAIARAMFNAGQTDAALGQVRAAQADDPAAPEPVLLALEMLPGSAAAEPVVAAHLARSTVDPAVRLAYVRALTQTQRYVDAVAQLQLLTSERPQLAQPWLTLGALQIELKRPKEAEAALLRHVDLASAANGSVSSAPAADSAEDSDDDTPRNDLTQAWLLLAQAAELRGDIKGAETWLAKIDNPQRAIDVQSRRAALLARQGQIDKARALIQAVPERSGDDARAKLMAEAQMLREAKRYREAADVMKQAQTRFADDIEIIYEQAMLEEKLDHFAEMERLLRRVIELRPDHEHAHNALGFSLADRGLRLPEAKALIVRALELAPGEPFITDSLGWVEYRMGNRDEAIKQLKRAYQSRPDPEIAAHLGEVLWVNGQHDEARRILREGKSRDQANDVLRETVVRLKVNL